MKCDICKEPIIDATTGISYWTHIYKEKITIVCLKCLLKECSNAFGVIMGSDQFEPDDSHSIEQ